MLETTMRIVMLAVVFSGLLTAAMAQAAVADGGLDVSWIGLQTDNDAPTPTGIPYLLNIEPRPGQENVQPDAVIRFDIICDKEIDTASIAITVDGLAVTPTLEPVEGGFAVEIVPADRYPADSEIAVTVDACSVAEDGGFPPFGDGDDTEQCMETFSYSFFTQTPTDLPPRIVVAGFGTTQLTEADGGKLSILALTADDEDPADVLSVRVYYEGKPTPLLLHDDGRHGDSAANDNVFGCEVDVPPGVAVASYLLQLRAFDRAGNPSALWPHVTVGRSYSSFASPPMWPSFEEMMAMAAFGDLGEDNEWRPRVLYGGFLDTSIDPVSGGRFNLAAFVDSPGGDAIASVELYAGLQPTGLLLQDDGAHGDFAAGDGVYGLSLEITTPVPAGTYLLSVVARDVLGRLSTPWPYLTLQ